MPGPYAGESEKRQRVAPLVGLPGRHRCDRRRQERGIIGRGLCPRAAGAEACGQRGEKAERNGRERPVWMS